MGLKVDKIIKIKILKIGFLILVGFLTLIITISLWTRHPFTQTMLANVAMTYLSNKLNTEIKIDRLEIKSFKSIALKNLLIKDIKKDTLLLSRRILVDINKINFENYIINFQKLELRNADFRLRTYKDAQQSNLRVILNYFKKQAKEDSTEITTIEEPEEKQYWKIKLKEIRVSESKFTFDDQNIDHKEFNKVDFKDIEIKNLDLIATNAIVDKDTFSVDIQHIAVVEKTGFYVDSLSCNFKISPVLLQAKNLLIKTAQNNLDLDLKFSFNNFKDFKYFINKIHIESNIRPSVTNLSEVGYFAPVMYKMDNRIKISGDIRGTVDNFKAKDFKFGYGGTTQFRGDVQMNGLPDVKETFSHLSIRDFSTTSDDIRNIDLPAPQGNIVLPELLKNLGKVKITGKFTGFYNDFVSYGKFKSSLGLVQTDLLLRVNENNDIEYTGKLEANNFDAGKMFNVENYLGELDLIADISGSGVDFETMNIRMDGILDSLHFKNNLYNEIILHGSLAEQKFNGDVKVTDDNINFDFNGSIDYGSHIPQYNFIASIEEAKLHEINLINRDTSSSLSMTMNINFMGNTLDNLQGIIIIDSTNYHELGEDYSMRDFTLSITRDATNYTFITLYSDLVDANIEGDFLLQELPLSVQNLFNQYLDTLFTVGDSTTIALTDQDFIFDIKLKNTESLSALFVPDLSIAEGTKITGGYNSKIGNIFIDGSSSEINYFGRRLQNWHLDFYARNQELYLNTGGERLLLTDTINIDSLNIICRAYEDTVKYNLSWFNDEHRMKSFGDLKGYLALLGQNRMKLKLNEGQIMVADTLWKINRGNYILFDSSLVHFHNIGFNSYQQEISLEGKVSENDQDTLMFGFDNFNLSNLDLLLKESKIDLDGTVTGFIKIANFYKSPVFLSDLGISDLYMNQEKLGDANIFSAWNPENESFNILGDIIYTGNVGQSKTLIISGSYFPNTSTDNFDIDIRLNNYKLSTIEPFLKSFSSRVKGLATGEFKLNGSESKPILTGEVSLMRTQMLIDYMNVSYYFADKIYAKENLFWFDRMIVNDSLNNQAIASGTIHHNYFNDFYFDLNFDANKLAGMNTTRSQNSSFYGKAFASGKVRIFGPVDELNMEIGIKSEKGTDLKIPPSLSTAAIENDYIIFANETEDTVTYDKYRVNIKGLSLNLNLEVTQDADIQIFMPYQMGNLSGTGNGNIIMNITPDGEFNMVGDYVLYRGSFFLTLQGIINRNFDIRRGSRVSWTGDPYNAKINMKAVYGIKTVLGDYGPPEDSATRVQVDCIITLTNNLLDPEIRFGIEFPNTKDDVKQTIYSRLDTNDQAMMSQQMISLLVMNSFYNPSGATGSVGFNTFSLVTNQLNNWLSSISKDFDIGINYRPGDELSANEVEVALSTQLFDDRVAIDGNVGMKGTENTQNTNSIVGEVTVEVKISPDGRFRAKVFNISNNNYLYKNYSPYTQGVGVFYTKEFNRFKDIFRKKSSRKTKKLPADQTVLE